MTDETNTTGALKGRAAPHTAPLTVEHVKTAKKAMQANDDEAGMAKITVRLPLTMICQIDIASHKWGGSRSRAIRHLILIGLNGEQP